MYGYHSKHVMYSSILLMLYSIVFKCTPTPSQPPFTKPLLLPPLPPTPTLPPPFPPMAKRKKGNWEYSFPLTSPPPPPPSEFRGGHSPPPTLIPTTLTPFKYIYIVYWDIFVIMLSCLYCSIKFTKTYISYCCSNNNF